MVKCSIYDDAGQKTVNTSQLIPFCLTPISIITSNVPESFLSSQNHKPFESESSQTHLKFFRVRVMTWSSRVTRTVESLRVIGLQARVNVESHEISRLFYDRFLLWNSTQHAIKWRPISLKMVPNVVSTSLIAGYLYLSSPTLHFTCLFHTQSFQRV